MGFDSQIEDRLHNVAGNPLAIRYLAGDQQDGDFVTTHPRDDVAATHVSADVSSDGSQNFIASTMTTPSMAGLTESVATA